MGLAALLVSMLVDQQELELTAEWRGSAQRLEPAFATQLARGCFAPAIGRRSQARSSPGPEFVQRPEPESLGWWSGPAVAAGPAGQAGAAARARPGVEPEKRKVQSRRASVERPGKIERDRKTSTWGSL